MFDKLKKTKNKGPKANTRQVYRKFDKDDPIMEAYRILRTNIEFSGSVNDIKALVVTSSNQGEGKSTTAANLAKTFAYAGKKTLIVDFDMRRPSQHRVHGVDNVVGIADIIVGKAKIEDAVKPTETENLFIITSGYCPPNPSELIMSKKVGETLNELRDMFDMIILDTPPSLILTDATLLSKVADATILVISAGVATYDEVEITLDNLQKAGIRLLGTVLNNSATIMRSKKKYYRKYYKYGY